MPISYTGVFRVSDYRYDIASNNLKIADHNVGNYGLAKFEFFSYFTNSVSLGVKNS